MQQGTILETRIVPCLLRLVFCTALELETARSFLKPGRAGQTAVPAVSQLVAAVRDRAYVAAATLLFHYGVAVQGLCRTSVQAAPAMVRTEGFRTGRVAGEFQLRQDGNQSDAIDILRGEQQAAFSQTP